MIYSRVDSRVVLESFVLYMHVVAEIPYLYKSTRFYTLLPFSGSKAFCLSPFRSSRKAKKAHAQSPS